MKRLSLFFFLLSISFVSAQETVQRALQLVEAKDLKGARAMLEAIVERNDADHEAHYRLGTLLFDRFQDLDAAQEQLERAVELADNHADYHFTLGRVYGAIAQNGGMFTGMKYARKVRDEFLRAVELEPNNISYRTGLMRYYIQAPAIVGGSIEKARDQANAMTQLDPWEGHMAFAEIATAQEDRQAAEAEYKAAIAANPGRPQAHFRLGYYYLSDKRVDEAVTEFREYVRCAPDDPNSHDSLGEGLLEKGRYDEALPEFGKALALNPGYISSFYGTARCYEGKGMRAEALSYYQKYLSFAPKGKTAETAKKKVEALQE